jgi:hypothetical protein
VTRGRPVALAGKFFRVGDIIYEIIAAAERGSEDSARLLDYVAESFTTLEQAKPAATPGIPVKQSKSI